MTDERKGGAAGARERKPPEAGEPAAVTGAGITTDITGEQHAHPEPIANAEDVQTYTVQKGDTLATISQRFYGNPHQVKRIMDANRDRLENGMGPGDLLLIPPEE